MRWYPFVAVVGFMVGCTGGDAPPEGEGPGAMARVAASTTATCGNGIVEEGELCDSSTPVACTALSALYTAGQTVCASNCQSDERDARVRRSLALRPRG